MTEPYEEIEAGRQAGELFNALAPYFGMMEAGLLNQFRDCPVRDTDGLVLLKLQHKALEALKLNIQSIITTGHLADVKLSEGED